MRTGKKTVLVVAWVGFAISLAVSGANLTNEGSLPVQWNGVGRPSAPVWTITTLEDHRSLRIIIECPGFLAMEVKGGYSLSIPGQVLSVMRGTPDVPHVARLLPDVPEGRAVLSLKGGESTNLTGFAVAPVEGISVEQSNDGTRSPVHSRKPDATLYSRNEFWPPELGKVDQAWIGTQNVVRVECFPVQYNPLTKTIRFYRRLEGVLRFAQAENNPSP